MTDAELKAAKLEHCPVCGAECAVKGNVTKYYVPEYVRLKAIETAAREFIEALAQGDTSSDEKLAKLSGLVEM